MAKVDLKAFTAELANELANELGATVDGKRVSEDVKKTGSHKIQYTWYA